MDYRILGPLEVHAGDGVVALAGSKPRTVLAMLLLHANQPVSAERLAVALWGDEAPPGAVRTVQVHMSRLRKALGPGDVISRAPAGYRLRVEPGELDSERFAQLATAGRGALTDGDAEQAGQLLREALALWRGAPLADVGFEPFAQAAIARLEEQRWEALEARVEADLQAGRHTELVPELQDLVRRQPLREHLRGLLMLALYRSGRQADALATFHAAREALVEELGVDPGPALRELYERILRHEDALRPAPPPAAGGPSTLPPRNPFFVGRETVIATVAEALSRSDRVALTGMPGVGKTQVALEYAERRRDQYGARLWVRADTRDALYSDVAAIARALRLTEHTERRQEHIVELVREWLSMHAGWLLVLDNAEDLEMAAGLLATDGAGHVLVTTRETGRGEIAGHVTIEPLDTDRSVDLLLLRSRAAERELPAAERAAARAACERLGGLALAVDQAGAFIAQTRSTVAEYLDALESETAATLTDGGGSVGATLTLAARRLREQDEAAADLLRLCAFFAAEAIPEEILTSGSCCPGEPLGIALAQPLDRLKVLRGALRYSLLQRDPQTRTLTVHRLVQAVLAAEMAPAVRDAWARHAGLALAAAFPTPNFSNWPLCERLMPHVLACADHLERAGIEFEELGVLLNFAGVYLRQRGRQQEGEPVFRRALGVLERTAGDRMPLAWGLHNLGALTCDLGRLDEAESLSTQAWAIAERELDPGDPWRAWFLTSIARVAKLRGRYDVAEQALEQAVRIRRSDGETDPEGIAWSLQGLGDLYLETDRYHEAETVLAEALTLRRGVLGDDHPHLAWTMASLGAAYAGQGRADRAEPLLRDALALAESALGDRHGIVAVILRRYAALLAATGGEARAGELLARADAINAVEAG